LPSCMELVAYWEEGYRCRVPVRDFEIVADEPRDLGGSDAGPTPTELLVSALASCFAMAVYHAARKRDVELPDLRVRVHATYERLRFDRLRIEVESSHPRAELQGLVDVAARWCYVSNTLMTPCDLDVTIADVNP
jgi:putative redox protein